MGVEIAFNDKSRAWLMAKNCRVKKNNKKLLIIFYIIACFYPKRQKRLGFLLKEFEALIEKVVWFKL
ncbi:hypothetical protein HpCS36_09370 [Helicobacter pylori]